MYILFEAIYNFLIGLIPIEYHYIFEEILVFITVAIIIGLIWLIVIRPLLKLFRVVR